MKTPTNKRFHHFTPSFRPESAIMSAPASFSRLSGSGAMIASDAKPFRISGGHAGVFATSTSTSTSTSRRLPQLH